MLIKNGFKKGDVLGINLPNIPEFVIAWLGALRAGCAVSGVSPLLSTEEMEYQLKDSDAKGLITLDAIFEGRLTKIAAKLPKLKVVLAASIGGYLPAVKRVLGKLLKKFPTGKVTPLPKKTVYLMEEVTKPGAFSDKDPALKITPDDVAYIQYTGGTTGLPKGAMLSHRNAASNMLVYQKWLGWERGKGLGLSGYPFFHMAGLFVNMNAIYLAWSQILVPNPRDTKYITSQIKKYRPTILINVPSLYQLLMAEPKFKTLDHSNLSACISSASPFPKESQKELEAIVGKGKLIENYGMSETSPLIAGNPSKGKRKLGSIGLPLLNTDVKLVYPVSGKEVGVPNPERPGSEIVKAFIQLKSEYKDKDKDALKKDIMRYAKEKLTPYEAPKVIEFMDEIPLTAVGKMDKKRLRV
jgi:long-chain acyl-CoA synthetase